MAKFRFLKNVELIDFGKIPLDENMRCFLKNFKELVLVVVVNDSEKYRCVSVIPSKFFTNKYISTVFKEGGFKLKSKIIKINYSGEDFLNIPVEFLSSCGVKNRVSIINVGAAIEIWNPVFFDKHRIEISKDTEKLFEDLVGLGFP